MNESRSLSQIICYVGWYDNECLIAWDGYAKKMDCIEVMVFVTVEELGAENEVMRQTMSNVCPICNQMRITS